jgi:hypothetical protein
MSNYGLITVRMKRNIDWGVCVCVCATCYVRSRLGLVFLAAKKNCTASASTWSPEEEEEEEERRRRKKP